MPLRCRQGHVHAAFHACHFCCTTPHSTLDLSFVVEMNWSNVWNPVMVHGIEPYSWPQDSSVCDHVIGKYVDVSVAHLFKQLLYMVGFWFHRVLGSVRRFCPGIVWLKRNYMIIKLDFQLLLYVLSSIFLACYNFCIFKTFLYPRGPFFPELNSHHRHVFMNISTARCCR